MAFVALPLACVPHRSIWAILQTPRTCENFIKLCKKQYYDGTIFHRSIRNFVVSDVGQHWPHRARSVLEVTLFVAGSPFSSGAETTKAHVFSPRLSHTGLI